MTLVLIAVSETTTWGWGSAKTIGMLVAGGVICAAWVAVEVEERAAADRHDADARARGVDREPDGVPPRRGHVRVVRRLPAVRAAAEEHRLRVRRVGGRLGALSAAVDDRDVHRRLRCRAHRRALRVEARARRRLDRHGGVVRAARRAARPRVRHAPELDAARHRNRACVRRARQHRRAGGRRSSDRRRERDEHGDAHGRRRARRSADRDVPRRPRAQRLPDGHGLHRLVRALDVLPRRLRCGGAPRARTPLATVRRSLRGSRGATDGARPVRSEPDRHAARRQRAERGREPPDRRLDAAAPRRHGCSAERSGRGGGDRRGPELARDRVGRRPGAPERAGRASRGGGAGGRAAAAIRRRDALARRRLADVSSRDGRRRHRLRDHARDPRFRPSPERGAACGAASRARNASRRR